MRTSGAWRGLRRRDGGEDVCDSTQSFVLVRPYAQRRSDRRKERPCLGLPRLGLRLKRVRVRVRVRMRVSRPGPCTWPQTSTSIASPRPHSAFHHSASRNLIHISQPVQRQRSIANGGHHTCSVLLTEQCQLTPLQRSRASTHPQRATGSQDQGRRVSEIEQDHWIRRSHSTR